MIKPAAGPTGAEPAELPARQRLPPTRRRQETRRFAGCNSEIPQTRGFPNCAEPRRQGGSAARARGMCVHTRTVWAVSVLRNNFLAKPLEVSSVLLSPRKKIKIVVCFIFLRPRASITNRKLSSKSYTHLSAQHRDAGAGIPLQIRKSFF